MQEILVMEQNFLKSYDNHKRKPSVMNPRTAHYVIINSPFTILFNTSLLVAELFYT